MSYHITKLQYCGRTNFARPDVRDAAIHTYKHTDVYTSWQAHTHKHTRRQTNAVDCGQKLIRTVARRGAWRSPTPTENYFEGVWEPARTKYCLDACIVPKPQVVFSERVAHFRTPHLGLIKTQSAGRIPIKRRSECPGPARMPPRREKNDTVPTPVAE
jgi:hypothetical protein